MLLGAASCSKTEEMNLPVTEPETQVKHLVVTPTRNYEEAQAIARQSIALVDRPATRNGESQTDTLLYVFNFEDDNGFAVIAANRAVDPILAVTEKGSYTYGEKTGVENFDFYMDILTSGLGDIVRPPIFDTMITIPAFKTVEIDEERHCAPLLPVNWGQEGFFGDYAKNKKAGCVAVAMAQIMAYHRFPTSITTTYPNDGYTQHYGETIELDWNNLIAYPYTYKISALLREIGTKVNMKYDSPNESTASSSNVPNGFKVFGYNCDSNLSNFTATSIQGKLDKNQPIYIDGRNSANTRSGHAWVLDGYTYTRKGTEYYELQIIDNGTNPYRDYVLVSSNVVTTSLAHYNWGWDGFYNGYFAATTSVDAVNCTYINLTTLAPQL